MRFGFMMQKAKKSLNKKIETIFLCNNYQRSNLTLLNLTMMRFTFTENQQTFGQITEEDNLENKIDRISEYSPKEQLALLYNDTKNHLEIQSQPYQEWYEKRVKVIEQYAELNWNGLGNHLNQHRMTLGSTCTSIDQGLQLLLSEMHQMKRFQMTVFCSILGKIDYLFHILLPSFVKDIQDPSVLHLLQFFKQI